MERWKRPTSVTGGDLSLVRSASGQSPGSSRRQDDVNEKRRSGRTKKRLLIASLVIAALVVVATVVTVVVPVGAVTLHVDQETYNSRQAVTLTLTNRSTGKVYHGQPFTVQRFENGSWVRVPLDLGFTLELRVLRPGQEFEQSFIPRHDLVDRPTPGRYRVVKEVWLGTILSSNHLELETRTLVAEFRIG